MKLHNMSSSEEAKDIEAETCASTSDTPPLPKGGLKIYWKENNQKSMDGLPGLLSAFNSPTKFVTKSTEKWGQDDESIPSSDKPLEASPGRSGLFYWMDIKLFLCFLLGWVACVIWTNPQLGTTLSPSVVRRWL